VRARIAMALRLTTAALLVLALVGVGVPQPVNRQATVLVTDVSSSVLGAQPQVADFLNQALGAKRPDDAYAVVSTARVATVADLIGAVGGGGRCRRVLVPSVE